MPARRPLRFLLMTKPQIDDQLTVMMAGRAAEKMAKKLIERETLAGDELDLLLQAKAASREEDRRPSPWNAPDLRWKAEKSG